jgi:hypothetical protein
VIRLPFPIITTLRMTALFGRAREMSGVEFGRVLTIFIDPHDPAVTPLRIMPPDKCPEPSWIGLAMTGIRSYGWSCAPPTLFLIDGSGPGLTLRIANSFEWDAYAKLQGLAQSRAWELMDGSPLSLRRACS